MPDETTTTTIEAPVTPSTTSAGSGQGASEPSSVPGPVSGGGGDALAQQLEGLLTRPKSTEKVPDKSEPKLKPQEKAKPEAKQPDKQQTKEPEKQKQAEAETNFAKLKKKVAEIEAEYAGYKNTAAETEEKLKRQIQVLESRKVLTPEHEKKLEQLQKELADRDAKLYAFDYSQSPEYKQKYEEKWTKESHEAMRDIQAMQVVTGKDEETGKETFRNATVADWKRVMDAPSKPEAWRVARELFGEQANIAMDHRNTLKSIESQAQEEVETRRKNYDTEQAKQKEQVSKWSETHSRVGSEYDAELLKKYGTLFTGDPARPEEAKKVEEGTRFVEEALNSKDMSVEEHAKRSAVLKRWAMSFPLMNDRVQYLQGKVSELEEELSKFRKSDPGEATGEPTPSPQPVQSMGSDDMAKQLEAALHKK